MGLKYTGPEAHPTVWETFRPMRFRRGLGVSELLRTKEAKSFTATWHSMALAHRLCRLLRLLPLAAAAASSKPYLPGKPSPAPPPPLSSPLPFPSLSRLFSTTPSSSGTHHFSSSGYWTRDNRVFFSFSFSSLLLQVIPAWWWSDRRSPSPASCPRWKVRRARFLFLSPSTFAAVVC